MSIASRLAFLAALAVLLGLSCPNGRGLPSACAADSWQGRFQQEAPQSWDRYRARATRIQGSFTLTFASLMPDRQVTAKWRIEFKQREGCALYLQQSEMDNEKDREGWLRAVNPTCAFELHRKTPDSPWAIARVQVDVSGGAPFRDDPREDVDIWSTCPFNFALVFTPLRVIAKDPGFTVVRVTPLVRDGREWAKVEFEYSSQGNARIPSVAGWVLYDPDRYWVIGEYDLQLYWKVNGAKATTAATYEYKDTGDGFPILTRIDKHFKRPDKSYESEDTYEFDLRQADVLESDFTLSAFGFPEPVGLERPPIRWYIWAAVLGFVCLGLAALLRWRARRAEHVTAKRLTT
jgi:hypothetical protein